MSSLQSRTGGGPLAPIFVARVGNIFRGDAVGLDVVRLLARRALPEVMPVVDFAIRGHTLADAFVDGYDGANLVDLARHSGKPGTPLHGNALTDLIVWLRTQTACTQPALG